MGHHGNSFGSNGSMGYVKPAIDTRGLSRDYRDKKPVPPLSEYQAYIERRKAASARPRGIKADPARLRRAAILRRGGEGMHAACRIAGVARQEFEKMPVDLQ